jgi:tRNA A37 methylthiotransferase MiaB
MRASLYTFGCKLNQYETEALASEFRGQGFSLVSPDEAAEVYIINTCTVTEGPALDPKDLKATTTFTSDRHRVLRSAQP